MAEKVRIRALDSHEDFEKVLSLQRAVWKHEDVDLTPAHQFAISSRMGAILLGAFVGRKLAGFVYSFPAVFQGKCCQHSHLLAVLPDFQGCGLGKALKWAQRKETAKLGYDLITWTFDPLQTRNANLNLQALGAFSRTYLHNFYGLTPSLCLGPGIPTDRLLVEWPICASRVKGRLKRNVRNPCYDMEKLPKALERKPSGKGEFAPPGRARLNLKDAVVLVEAPRDVKALGSRFDLIAEWQTKLRRVMQHYFGRGYAADHFIYGHRCFYVLNGKSRRRT